MFINFRQTFIYLLYNTDEILYEWHLYTAPKAPLAVYHVSARQKNLEIIYDQRFPLAHSYKPQLNVPLVCTVSKEDSTTTTTTKTERNISLRDKMWGTGMALLTLKKGQNMDFLQSYSESQIRY